jgi:hypothetical protein
MTQSEKTQRIQLWVTRGLLLIVIFMALLWGLTNELAKRAVRNDEARLKNTQKQTTMQGKETE